MMSVFRSALRHCLPRSFGIHTLRRQSGNCVLLTFDDGPHPVTTRQVLDRLREHGVRAMFFVVGQRVARAPNVLRDIVAEGHWLGNHTFSHPNDRKIGYREYLADLTRCQHAVFAETAQYPRYHRPPMGQVTAASLLAPRRLGFVTLFWSISAEDWRFRDDELAIQRGHELAREVTAGDVVLMHDDRPHVLRTLDVLLPALRDRGINMSPMDGDLA